jgi:DNA-binding IclR family transcriptional regulator
VLLASLPPGECRELLARLPLRAMTARTITDAETLFAHLASVREQGYAVDDQELEDDLVCIAAPIRDHSGAVVAALSVSAHRLRMAGEFRAAVIAWALEATARISAALGAAGPQPARVEAAQSAGT